MSDSPADTPEWVPVLVDAIRDALAVPADCRCLSREQAADALGISTRKLDALAASGDGPPSIAVDARRLYPVAALRRWITDRIDDR